jgi:hypothetical protein
MCRVGTLVKTEVQTVDALWRGVSCARRRIDMTAMSQGFAQHDHEWIGHTTGPVVPELGETIEDMVAICILDLRLARVCKARSGMIDNLARIGVKGLPTARAWRLCRAGRDVRELIRGEGLLRRREDLTRGYGKSRSNSSRGSFRSHREAYGARRAPDGSHRGNRPFTHGRCGVGIWGGAY